ncbi:HEAT repeat domain-containing protein [Thermogutta sp.]|uniref:HEAT repeat domain-containing protein n=1 Tax=Thermogutta sp. TaxID=1962930 RepID=UPI00321FA861
MEPRKIAISIVLCGVVTFALRVGTFGQQPPVPESDLVAILKSDAPKGDKALACKKLAVFGTAQAVPVLAPLLADPELASWARIALEAIPDPACDAALREAAGKLDGRLAVGVINSIGVRRDPQAIEVLTQRLGDNDVDVAAAAAAALGRIGGEKAIAALRSALKHTSPIVRNAAAEGLLSCADRYLGEGNAAAAQQLYDLVRSADVPKPRRVEATRGAILARGVDGLSLLVEQLKSNDKDLVAIALSTAREIKGPAVAQALVAELGPIAAAPQQRPPVLVIKSARYGAGDRWVDVTEALRAAVRNNSLQVEASNSLAGDPAPGVVKELQIVYSLGDQEFSLRVKEGEMIRLGEGGKPADPRQAAILEALADIGDPAGIATIVKAAQEADWALRLVAVRLLGRLGDASAVPVLVSAATEGGELAQAAAESLVQLAGQGVDEAILKSLQSAQGPQRVVLLQAAGERLLGAALPTALADMNSDDPTVRTAAIRALGMIVPLEQLDVLIARLLKPVDDQDFQTVREALTIACSRMPELDAAAAKLMAVWPKASTRVRIAIVEILGTMGGQAALRGLAQAARDSEDEVQDAVTRVLGEWMSADAAPVLLDLARTGNPRYRIRALRGYIRIARQLDVPLNDRIAMCRNALAIAQRPEEKRLVLEVLRRYPTAEGLQLSVAQLAVPELKAEAAETAVQIAEKLPASDAAIVAKAMDQVIQAAPAAEILQRAQVLRQRTRQ